MKKYIALFCLLFMTSTSFAGVILYAKEKIVIPANAISTQIFNIEDRNQNSKEIIDPGSCSLMHSEVQYERQIGLNAGFEILSAFSGIRYHDIDMSRYLSQRYDINLKIGHSKSEIEHASIYVKDKYGVVIHPIVYEFNLKVRSLKSGKEYNLYCYLREKPELHGFLKFLVKNNAKLQPLNELEPLNEL
jgi:hypothetical protein